MTTRNPHDRGGGQPIISSVTGRRIAYAPVETERAALPWRAAEDEDRSPSDSDGSSRDSEILGDRPPHWGSGN